VIRCSETLLDLRTQFVSTKQFAYPAFSCGFLAVELLCLTLTHTGAVWWTTKVTFIYTTLGETSRVSLAECPETVRKCLFINFLFASKFIKDINIYIYIYIYPVFCMLDFASSNAAKICILVILNYFCLLPA
jgi:hypothetical protein